VAGKNNDSGANGGGGGGGSGGSGATGGSGGGGVVDAPLDVLDDGGAADAGVVCPTLPSGLVSWWKGEGNYVDAVGTNNGAAAGTVTFAPGVLGSGFSLDGTSNVQVPDAATLDLSGPFTIDAWVNPTGIGAARIVDKIAAGNTNGYLLDLTATNQLRMVAATASRTSSVTVPTGTFTHVAGVYTASTPSAFSLYVNGVMVPSTGAGTVAVIPNNAQPLRIGADSAGGNRFVGVIDEPRVWNRALTTAEIQVIFQQGSASHCACVPPPSGLVGWWPGDGDLTGVGGNATAVGPLAFADGAVGAGFRFDGTSAYAQVPDSASLDVTTALTIEAWINASALGGRIVDKITAGGMDGYLLDTLGGQLRIQVGAGSLTRAATTPLPTGGFIHVAGVYDGTNLGLYVNGASVMTAAAGVTAVPTNNLPLRIGADSTGAASLFNGVIDEPRIYNRALQTSEILAIYRQGASTRCR
jgi:hypothetical protein